MSVSWCLLNCANGVFKWTVLVCARVALRTTPMDDTGVPHILEHTALCGSQKYPVRDPFFKMLNRSLSTFMNAFTCEWLRLLFSIVQRVYDRKCSFIASWQNWAHFHMMVWSFPASDWTMYPFSTENAQDYKNLMSVYLDSVFFPRLRETDFRQDIHILHKKKIFFCLWKT